MVFRNTSWAAIELFPCGYTFSFCFDTEMDYCYFRGSQCSLISCMAFCGSYRGRCWSGRR